MYKEILAENIKIDKTLGYAYFIDKNHPLASANVGKVYYHRHIASISRGIWLLPNEVVHHIDHDKLNNVVSNLEVLSDQEHGLLHQLEQGSLGWTKNICPKCKISYMVYVSQRHKRVYCSEICAKTASVIWNISKENLELLIWNISYTNIAKNYPISDVGAKKKALALKCKMPPPYFFNKSEEYRKNQRKINNISDLPTQQSSKLLA